MTATPNADQLQRCIDAVAAGLDLDEAIEAIFPAAEPLPDLEVIHGSPKAEPKPKQPTVMVTEFPDGIVIGWDHCSVCIQHISKCKCKDGPKELAVFEKWRREADTMPDYGTATEAASKAVRKGKATTAVVVTAEQASEPRITPPSGAVPCRDGEHFVPEAEAEKNDDGSYTCFACQSAGSRSVQVDG